MKEYLLLFWNKAGDGTYLLDPEEMKKGMAAWQQWIGGIAAAGKLISTKPINYAGVTVSNSEISDSAAIIDGRMVTGYLIAKADSMDEVKEWAETCPILDSPDGFTESREVSPFEL
jgi:hypothetical protein